ncbi:MAG: hypothetical protein KatS3mg040_0817 [Candidatus Kapaibacterium sp.]|nr:MAG: hypothetical protein KatS3mg040_0817 [Candidatus Kapabacteria bacterium]
MIRNAAHWAIATLLLYSAASAQELRAPRGTGRIPTAAELLTNGSQGKEFYFCFPLNDSPQQPVTAREIYVTSSRNTRFRYEIPGLGFQKVFNVQAMRVTVLTLRDVPMPEAEESEVPLDLAVRIVADDPVSVYVYNGKQVSSDGYLAIPVQSWGNEYIHLGWPDFREFRNWKGGFAIVAAYRDTRVSIELRKPNIGDHGITSARTEKGRRYGATWTVTLQPGQCYLVQGDGTTRGEFDLSGSIVRANKPIGFISYHQRTMVPSFDIFNGRDHMIEMIPPTSMWGRSYVSIEYERGGYGDFFRVVALQDGTNIVCTTYDFRTKQKLEEFIMPGLKRGEVRSLPDAGLVVTGPGQATGVRGMSVWKSNKPFFLMQYSASAEWDNNNMFDPFMIYVVPIEQYTKATIFQAPSNPAYSRHRFNLIVSADINDPEQKDLRSIKVDGVPVTTLAPDILGNRIPGTNFHYARLFVNNGAHLIEGNAPFGGYIYGWGSFDSYGWPAATAYRRLDEFDTIPPPLSREQECGDYIYTARETGQDFPINDTLNHIGTGINAIDFVEGKPSFNYAIELLEADGNLITDNILPQDQKNSIVKFRLRVIDKTKDAQAYFYVGDRALNFSYDSVFWVAPKVSIRPNPIDAGNVRVGRSTEITATITNNADSTFLITDLRLKKGSAFAIVEPTIPPGGLALYPRQSIQVRLRYTPQTEHVRDNERDEDSLLVVEQCAPFAVQVLGRGIQPHIIVDDWDAGTVPSGQSRCHSQQLARGLRIRNPGTDTLTITDIDRSTIQPPFSLTDPTDPPLPITIPPGGEVFLKEMCFAPTNDSTFSITVRFMSDAPGSGGDKPWSEWKGQSISPGPIVIGNSWGRVRLGTTKVLNGLVRNDGQDQVQCTAVYLPANEQNFRIVGADRQPPFTLFPNGQDVVRVQIACTPQAEFDLTSRLLGDFTGVGTRSDALTAFGYLEKIEATGAIFRTPILVGTTTQSQAGNTEQFVTITNTSQSADLRVYAVELLPTRDPNRNLYPEDFQLLDALQDATLPIGAAPALLAVQFRPSGTGERKALVRILHNAEPPVPEPTGQAETIVELIGYGYTVNQPTLEGYDFGSVTTCDQPLGAATVTNTAPAGTPASDVEVIGATILGPDAAYFALESPPTPANPLVVSAGQTRPIAVRFLPDQPRGYSAFIRVEYRGGDADTAELRGVGYVIPIEVRTTFDSPLFNFRSGNDAGAQVQVRSLNWGGAQVYGFDIRVRYNAKQLLYVPNSITRGEVLDATWQLTAQESLDGTTSTAELLIQGRGQTPIAANGAVATLRFTVLISDLAEQRFATTAIAECIPYGAGNSERRCVIPTVLGDSLLPTTCFIDGRFVKVSTTTFSIVDVSPHPATSDAVTIRFGVGFDAPTSIRFYDALGNPVRTVLDGELSAGTYQLDVPIADMSSGLYFVRYESGPVRITRQLLIVR